MTWTILAAAGEPAAVAVDPKGQLVPDSGGWSLDWWVRAEDRWHHAGEEVAVRQRLASAGVAVETLMRVPGGDVVHSTYVCVAPGGAGAIAVVEVRNDSAVPVALALAVRPGDLRGRGSVDSVVDGAVVRVDGQAAIRLPGPPADVLADHLEPGDLACVFPLPHGATVRAALHLDPARGGEFELERLPGAEAVARGWSAHFGRATRLELPDPALQVMFDAARRRVVGACPGGVISFGAIDRGTNERDLALVSRALTDLGHVDEAAAVLDSVGWREPPEVASHAGDLAELIQSAAPTGAIATSDGGGTGDDLAAAAQLLSGVRRLVLDDRGGGELQVVPALPEGWQGQGVEIHDAPTSAGVASVAVRWHGSRPALLWSVEGEGPIRLTAPGLDASWEATARTGEALLAEFGVGEP